MRVDRLNKLVKVLKGLDIKVLFMSDFGTPYHHLHKSVIKEYNVPQCEFVCCSMGEYARSEVGKEDGWKTYVSEDPSLNPFLCIEWYGLNGWEAINNYFDLTYTKSFFLFYERSYGSSVVAVSEVIERIENFIATNKN